MAKPCSSRRYNRLRISHAHAVIFASLIANAYCFLASPEGGVCNKQLRQRTFALEAAVLNQTMPVSRPEEEGLSFPDIWNNNKNGQRKASNDGTLGDIMGGFSFLETKAPTSLAEEFGVTNPMDRLLLTANGNLQRLISSYYDSPVSVSVKYCEPVEQDVWHRQVQLIVHNQVFCTATSTIVVHSNKYRDLVASGQVGLGQLFRLECVLPACNIQEARASPDGRLLERTYTLQDPELCTCYIREEFVEDLWNIKPE